LQGSYIVKLALAIGADGVVRTASSEGAPTPAIKSRIEQQAQAWIFEQYKKGGAPAGFNVNTNVLIRVIKSR
jgi:hypothetical protein